VLSRSGSRRARQTPSRPVDEGPLQVLIWNEFRQERDDRYRTVYPDGIHAALEDGLAAPDLLIEVATLDEPEQGLSEQRLDETDILVWWGHIAHDEVADQIVDRVQKRVLAGMGLVALHSAHEAKIFARLLGTSGALLWRTNEPCAETLWLVNPTHPIGAGLGLSFVLEEEEAFGEWFDIPEPDELVFVSWFSSGEVFRSGCCFQRGRGRIFYFRPGHETFRSYYDPNVLRVIANAIRWARPPLEESTER
jgi:trehalose utilization protein